MDPPEGSLGLDGDDSAAARRWAEIRSAAEAALALPREERSDFLDHACRADPALRAEVEAQIDACERAAGSAAFLAEPAAALVAPLFSEREGVEMQLRAALAGRYDVERELGRGGMATVYLARDCRHDRSVALKVVDPALGAELSAERFLREIRVTAGLTHPHILPLHDSGESAGRLYYVMPYVAGETLRERLAREGALALPHATRLMRQVADALAYAHARGVVHRDIKPANILLADGHAMVADFGIARAVRRARDGAESDAQREKDGHASATLTAAGTSLGTPAYMAPEQALGDAATDHRADLYAFGVVAYEALAGAHPFGARSPQALVAAHLGEAPPPLGARRPDAPPALVALVMRCLEKDPATRPQSAAEIVATLETLHPTGESAAAMGPGRWWKRAPAGLVATAVVLLTAAGALAVVMSGSDREAPPIRDGVAGETRPSALRTVAVLPFVNTSGTQSDDYFSDGLTDELAHALGRLPGIRIAGRTSSYTFKGKTPTAQEIGRALDVGAFVGGTVRRSGDRLRVSAQLVSTTDGKVLWDSVYERRSGDVFAVQDEVTRAVVVALTPTLGDRRASAVATEAHGGRGTTDAEAYELYLKGRYYFLERGSANVARSIAYYRQAVARDPAFARAHAGLAAAYDVLPIYVADPTDSATALVTASAARALSLDSTLADAQLVFGRADARRMRFRDAEARIRTAIALDPSNVSAHQALGLLLLSLGRTDEALVETGRAAQLDPLAKSVGTAYALALIAARRFPEAVAASRRVLALDATFPLGIGVLGLAQTFGGQADSAVRTLEGGIRVHPDAPGNLAVLVLAYAAAGRWADAERVRAQLRQPGGDPSGGTTAAFAELVFGDREPLVRLLSTAAGQGAWMSATGALGCHPLLDPLWADARFRAAMRDIDVAVCPLARPWPVPARRGA